MSHSGPAAELRTLQRAVAEFERHFLARHLGAATLAPPSRQEVLDVGAFVVLTHGALENFVEGLALWVLSRVVDNWTLRKRASPSTASLLLHQQAPKLDETPLRVFDKLREELGAAKANHSKTISDNNGINSRHLRELFCPLGVNVPEDPVLAASVDALISMRHYWAHRSRFGASVIKAANDAKTTAADCLAFAERLSRAAAAARP